MKIISYIMIILCWQCPIYTQEPGLRVSTQLDLFILFEGGGSRSSEFIDIFRDARAGFLMQNFMHAIKHKQLTIISTPLLRMLIEASVERQPGDPFFKLFLDEDQQEMANRYNERTSDYKKLISDLKQEWELRLNLTKDFIILLPKQMLGGKSFSTFGFNEKLSSFNFDEALPGMVAIAIDNFKSLFNSTIALKLRILNMGHGASVVVGYPESLIAQMNQKEYIKFLNFLNTFSTEFLYIVSCYAGGSNALLMHQDAVEENKKIFSITNVKYPIALSGILDSPVVIKDAFDTQQFFKNLENYLVKPSVPLLKQTLQEIYKKMGSYSDLPVIRFPGSENFFKITNLDDVKVLTSSLIKAHELSFKQKNKKVLPLEFGNPKALLLYSANIPIPLQINASTNEMRIVSLIPGNAYHMIQELITPNLDFDDALKMFTQSSNTIKSFLIRKMICKDGVYEFVVLEQNQIKNQQTHTKLIAKVISSADKKVQNSFIKLAIDAIPYYLFLSWDAIKIIITPAEAQKEIQEIIAQSASTRESLYQATRGQETIEQLQSYAHAAFIQEIK